MDLHWSTVSRITGQNEEHAVDVLPIAGRNRLATESVDLISDTFSHAVKTVTTTPLLLTVGGSALENRKTLMIQNVGNRDIFIGDSSVSAANGIILYRKGTITLSVASNVAFYAVTDSSTSSVLIFEAR